MREPDIDDLRAAYPEWQIEWEARSGQGGVWHARLITSMQRPQPHLVAGSLADLAAAINECLAGGG